MTFFLDHLPPHIHLVIASRVDPPLPLARLRIRNQMMELRTSDLRFGYEEIVEFFKLKTGLSLSTEEVAVLQRRTEGWAAGLQSLVLSMGKRQNILKFAQTFQGDNRFVSDFLTSEVLDRLPAEILTFLFETSILDRLNGSLCDAVTGRDNSQDILEMLEQSNLFIIPLDHNRRWYRYHSLFADLLRSRLQQMQSAEWVSSLHCRASEWYSVHEMPSEAIHHALAAHNFESAVSLVEVNYLKLCERGEFYTLYCWLNALPESWFSSHPLLLIARAWVEIVTALPDAAEQHIEAVEQLISGLNPHEATPLSSIKSIVLILRALIAAQRGDTSQCIELATQALLLLPAEDLYLRNFGQHAIGTAFARSQNPKQTILALNEASIASRVAGNFFLAMVSMYYLANQYRYQGRLHKAEETFRQASALVTEQGEQELPIAGLALIGLGDLQRERNDLAAAQQLLIAGIEQIQQMGSIEFLTDGYIALARVKQAQGDLAGSLQILQKTDIAVRKYRNTRMIAMVEAYLAHFQVTAGDAVMGINWAESNNLRIDQEDIPLKEIQQTTLARVLIRQGRTEEALLILDQLLQQSESVGRIGSVIEILILRALILHSERRQEEAFVALEQALTLAKPEHYVRIFADEGKPMAILLYNFIRSKCATAHVSDRVSLQYVNMLLTATEFETLEDWNEPLVQEQPLVVSNLLTKREMEVYHLLEIGYTNRDIAQTLFISDNTVKTHRKAIYAKLEVNNRAQMIQKAKELKLL